MKNTELLGEYRAQYDAEIKWLKAENLNLRCCGNCKWCNAGKDDRCYDAQNNICDRWKSDGLTQERRK